MTAEPQDNVTALGGELLIKDVDIGTETRGEVGRIELGALLSYYSDDGQHNANHVNPSRAHHHARYASDIPILQILRLYQLRHVPLILVLSPQPASLISFIIRALEWSVRIDRRTRDETRKEGANRS